MGNVSFIILIFAFYLVTIVGTWFSAFNRGEMRCESRYQQIVIESSQLQDKRIAELKKQLSQLEKEKVHNEECDYIRSYDLRSNCRK